MSKSSFSYGISQGFWFLTGLLAKLHTWPSSQLLGSPLLKLFEGGVGRRLGGVTRAIDRIWHLRLPEIVFCFLFVILVTVRLTSAGVLLCMIPAIWFMIESFCTHDDRFNESALKFACLSFRKSKKQIIFCSSRALKILPPKKRTHEHTRRTEGVIAMPHFQRASTCTTIDSTNSRTTHGYLKPSKQMGKCSAKLNPTR
jgi:type IV secretory pathway VirB3-like protein